MSSLRCPECGAPPIDGMTCWDMLGGLIAWEAQDPELQALHFFTVASYNLQHPASFTDEAIQGLRALFLAAIDEGLPPSEILRRARIARFGQGKVKRGGAQPVFRPWSLTIADAFLGQPQGAAERVRTWTASIRREC